MAQAKRQGLTNTTDFMMHVGTSDLQCGNASITPNLIAQATGKGSGRS